MIEEIDKCQVTRKIPVFVRFVGEDEQNETFNNEVEKKDFKIIASKERKKEQKQEYQRKYRLQQA